MLLEKRDKLKIQMERAKRLKSRNSFIVYVMVTAVVKIKEVNGIEIDKGGGIYFI